jgi:hypothetical protein
VRGRSYYKSSKSIDTNPQKLPIEQDIAKLAKHACPGA